MKCPVCNNEMELGKLCARGGGGMYWLPKDAEIKLLVSNRKIEKHGGEIVVDTNHMGAVKHPAYICRLCNRILLEF